MLVLCQVRRLSQRRGVQIRAPCRTALSSRHPFRRPPAERERDASASFRSQHSHAAVGVPRWSAARHLSQLLARGKMQVWNELQASPRPDQGRRGLGHAPTPSSATLCPHEAHGSGADGDCERREQRRGGGSPRALLARPLVPLPRSGRIRTLPRRYTRHVRLYSSTFGVYEGDDELGTSWSTLACRASFFPDFGLTSNDSDKHCSHSRMLATSSSISSLARPASLALPRSLRPTFRRKPVHLRRSSPSNAASFRSSWQVFRGYRETK